jgi:hypothetical protein
VLQEIRRENMLAAEKVSVEGVVSVKTLDDKVDFEGAASKKIAEDAEDVMALPVAAEETSIEAKFVSVPASVDQVVVPVIVVAAVVVRPENYWDDMEKAIFGSVQNGI